MALTPSERAYVEREHAANALKFGADARWVLHHPGTVAAVLGALAFAQPEIPLLGVSADAFSLGAAGSDVHHHDYAAVALDVSAAGFGRSAAIEGRMARVDAKQVAHNARTYRRIQAEIRDYPGPVTPPKLAGARTSAIKALRASERVQEIHRDAARIQAATDMIFAFAAAAWVESQRQR